MGRNVKDYNDHNILGGRDCYSHHAHFVGFGTIAARKSAKAAQDTANLALREAEVRNRPWLRVIEITYLDNSDQAETKSAVLIKFDNIGTVPAENAELSVVFNVDREQYFNVERTTGDLMLIPSQQQKKPHFDILFPGELSDGSFEFKGISREQIISLEAKISGAFTYYQAEISHVTKFVGEFNLRDDKVIMTWQHTEAT